MNYQTILQNLKKINFDNGTKGKAKEFRNIFVEQFLNDMNIIDEECYRINSSIGIGNLADTWWCGIFDYDYYNNHLHIYKKKSISASKGYYVVYLINKEKTRLFLSINSASKDIRKKSEEERNKKLKINAFLRDHIALKPNYLVTIDGKLSENKNDLARDYEIGSIVSIEYDLFHTSISNERFKMDLINILEDFEIVKKYLVEMNLDFEFIAKTEQGQLIRDVLTNNTDYAHETIVEDAETTNKSQIKSEKQIKELKPLTQKELDDLDNRKPSYEKPSFKNKKPKAIRNKKIAEDVLLKANYQCCIEKEHKTFMGKYGHKFVVPHHLIPLEFQPLFNNYNLDRSENIVCVCPSCHAAIHYGCREIQYALLRPLYENSPMKQVLIDYGEAFNFKDFIEKFYNEPSKLNI